MMTVKISLNDSFGIVDLMVVRINPTRRQPKDGEICTYELFKRAESWKERDELLTEFEFPYGDGVALGIEMLEVYQSVLEFEEDEKKDKTNG